LDGRERITPKIKVDDYDLQQVLTERLEAAITSACDEIADMAISFPRDKRTWAEIIKRHLKLAANEMLILVLSRTRH
jgi:hypothetical protein